MRKEIIGIILAGGRGKRMDVLCEVRPKPVLPYAGTYRVIDFTLSNCVHSGVKDILTLVDHRRIEMTRYFRQWHSVNREIQSLTILHPRKDSYSGTADAVYQNLSYLNMPNTETVLVLAGDHIYNMDYRGILDFHNQVRAEATVGVVQVPIEQAYRFGTVITDSDGRITEFVEKSSSPNSDLASMGIYVFNRVLLERYVSEDAKNLNSPHDFGYAILPKIMEKGKMYAFKFDGYWQDIGTVEAYYNAHMDLLGAEPRFVLNNIRPVLGKRKIRPWPSNRECNNIVNSLISPGCEIDGYVENSILSPGVRVEKYAEIRNSVIMANVSIASHSIIERCILDERARVGEFCCIGYNNGAKSESQKVTILGKGAKVPEHTVIGSKCIVSPYAGPDNFLSRAIPSGTIVPSPA
jgi:glucose-1-phosphate adenylyltransferase